MKEWNIEFNKGYNQAIKDMVKLIRHSNMSKTEHELSKKLKEMKI